MSPTVSLPAAEPPKPETEPSPAVDTPARRGLSASGIITIVLTLLGWTTIPLFLHSFRHDIDAWTGNGWRYSISALLWAPVLVVAWARGTLPKGLWSAALWPSIWNSAAQVCYAMSLYYADPPMVTFGLRLQIVFLVLGAAVMFPAERRLLRSGPFLVCLLTVLAATLVTVALDPSGLKGGSLAGVSLAVGSGLLYALYALAVRRKMSGMNPVMAFAVVSQYTAAVLVAAMLAFGAHYGADAAHLKPGMFLMLVLSAVIGIGLGHTLYFFSIARLGLVASAGVVQLQPITVSLAFMLIGGGTDAKDHGLHGWQWVTGSIAVAGAVAMLMVQGKVTRKS